MGSGTGGVSVFTGPEHNQVYFRKAKVSSSRKVFATSHIGCCAHDQLRTAFMGLPIKFSRWGKVDILLILFRLLTAQCNRTFTKRITLPTPQRKCPYVTATVTISALRWGSNASFSPMLLFTQYETTWLTAISTRQSLSPCITCQRCQCVTKRLWNYRNLKWTSEDSLPCYCYTIKTNSRSACKFRNLPLQANKWGEMSELQAHYCMTPEQWTLLLCSLSVIPANKL